MRMCPVLAAWALLAVPAAAADPEPLPDLQNTIQPMLEALCVDCHSADDASGDFDIEPLLESDDFHAHREEWRRVVKNVRGGMMPPEDAEQPDDEQRKTLSDGVDALLVHVDCRGPVDPGRVTLRRLNRNEYRRTVRDPLGVDYQPADDFPADDVGYGFDNIGDVLSLPPILMEKYLAAAEEIAARAIAADNPSRGAILFKLPDNKTPPREAARPIVQRLAERAFRRPVQREEVDRLLTLFDAAQQQGDHFEQSVALPMQAVLVSPHFLFKVEPSAGGQSKDKVVALNDFELATRLSYFLWSSMPDDELLRMARQGKLRRDDVLEAQTRRMLADPKAAALTENFAGQWLQLRNLDALTFDEKQFAQFDAELAAAMRRETEMLFETIMREDRSILDFLRADFTFVNGPLAAHYGIDGVEGDVAAMMAGA